MAHFKKRPFANMDGNPAVRTVRTKEGKQFSVADLTEALHKYVCYICNSCTGETMIRTDCRNCISQAYFCKSHLSRVPNRCSMCQTLGVKHRADWGVTGLLECAYINCPSDGCSITEVAKRMGEHLDTKCLYHVITCPLPGCAMR
jgi:hypothetical protein